MARRVGRSPSRAAGAARARALALGLTALLHRLQGGDESARDALYGLLYEELHERARGFMRGQRDDHTLQATALVNEAFLRLAGPRELPFQDRVHFLSVASKAMRHALVDHARTKNRRKRQASGREVPLDQLVVTFEDRALDLEALDAALVELAEHDEPMAQAVEMRFFGGLEVEETAHLLGMSKRTLERRWTWTRAWLLSRLA